MADKSTQTILAALSRAAAAPGGAPLFAAKSGPGLFPATAAGRQTAQRCKDEGWIRPVPAEPGADAAPAGAAGDTAVLVAKKAKTAPEMCLLTDKGLAWLLSQTSPRQVLEDFVRALESRQAQAAEMLSALRRMQAGLDALKEGAETVLARLARPEDGPADESLTQRFHRFRNEPAPDAAAVLLTCLTEWQPTAAGEDCPLPELFRRARAAAPALTVGAFHDGLRRLHDAGKVYLHPWTGPLHALPEPPFALLVGHEIAYYASRRQ